MIYGNFLQWKFLDLWYLRARYLMWASCSWSLSPSLVLECASALAILRCTLWILTNKLFSRIAQVFLDVMDFGMHLKDAVPAPRLHHQLLPNTLFAEKGFPTNMLQSLRNVGHDVEFSATGAVVQAIAVGNNGLIYAASDPRKGGKPSGYWILLHRWWSSS